MIGETSCVPARSIPSAEPPFWSSRNGDRRDACGGVPNLGYKPTQPIRYTRGSDSRKPAAGPLGSQISILHPGSLSSGFVPLTSAQCCSLLVGLRSKVPPGQPVTFSLLVQSSVRVLPAKRADPSFPGFRRSKKQASATCLRCECDEFERPVSTKKRGEGNANSRGYPVCLPSLRSLSLLRDKRRH